MRALSLFGDLLPAPLIRLCVQHAALQGAKKATREERRGSISDIRAPAGHKWHTGLVKQQAQGRALSHRLASVQHDTLERASTLWDVLGQHVAACAWVDQHKASVWSGPH
eukprot:scaffold23787_cov73-Phaeocystis_antarctica.AAC.1